MEQNTQLKLNTRRTVLIGFAFFGILALWQIYYFYCPLFLRRLIPEDFPNRNTIIGIIMAIDKLLAVVLIPLFGWLSDRTSTRLGRRMPYIIFGTIAAIILFPLMAVMFMINSLAGFIIVMVFLVIAMQIYRAPAVALMPDITPKPKRATANGIVNFMGYIGVILGSIVTMIFLMAAPDEPGMLPYIEMGESLAYIPFIFVSVLMLAALVLFVIKFNEKKVVAEVAADMALGEKLSETIEPIEEGKKLSKLDRRNFFIIFGCITLWFFAFNALNTFASSYAEEVLGGAAIGTAIAVMGVAGLATFLPSIKLTAKVGRKNSILIGTGLMIVPLIIGIFVTSLIPLLPLFAVAGVGWAIINLSSYPMLVEMSSAKNVGRITGYYYIAQQGSQALTSICVGAVLDWLGFRALFPYAAVFITISFILCLFFKTKKPEPAVLNQIHPVPTE